MALYTLEQIAQAIDDSIQHWVDNENIQDSDVGAVGCDNCALCSLFFKDDCLGCPIAETTGELFCAGSPYSTADTIMYIWRDCLEEDDSTQNRFLEEWRYREAFRLAARDERLFLEDIREKFNAGKFGRTRWVFASGIDGLGRVAVFADTYDEAFVKASEGLDRIDAHHYGEKEMPMSRGLKLISTLPPVEQKESS